MTAATHARLCNTAPQAPDSELRTSYIVIRTFKLPFVALLHLSTKNLSKVKKDFGHYRKVVPDN